MQREEAEREGWPGPGLWRAFYAFKSEFEPRGDRDLAEGSGLESDSYTDLRRRLEGKVVF